MRRAYSAQAVSAQAGSLAAIATTCSLGTGVVLRRLLDASAFDLHRLAAPYFLEVVEVAHRGMHDVHDYVAEIDQHPFAAGLALDAVDARAVLAGLLLHIVGERLHLACRLAARDHHPLEHRRHARGVVDMDVAPLDVLQRIHHHALLLADVHLTVEPVVGNIVRHGARHEALQRLAARGCRLPRPRAAPSARRARRRRARPHSRGARTPRCAQGAPPPRARASAAGSRTDRRRAGGRARPAGARRAVLSTYPPCTERRSPRARADRPRSPAGPWSRARASPGGRTRSPPAACDSPACPSESTACGRGAGCASRPAPSRGGRYAPGRTCRPECPTSAAHLAVPEHHEFLG